MTQRTRRFVIDAASPSHEVPFDRQDRALYLRSLSSQAAIRPAFFDKPALKDKNKFKLRLKKKARRHPASPSSSSSSSSDSPPPQERSGLLSDSIAEFITPPKMTEPKRPLCAFLPSHLLTTTHIISPET